MGINFKLFCIHIVTLQLAKIVESQKKFAIEYLHVDIWQQWISDDGDPQRVVTKSCYSKLMDDWNTECAQYFETYWEDGVPNPFSQKYEYIIEMLQFAIMYSLRDAIRDVRLFYQDQLKDIDISDMSLTKDLSEKILDRYKHYMDKNNVFKDIRSYQ